MSDLRKLAEAATPGPWKQHLVDDTCVTTGQCDVCTTFPEGGIDDDVDFNTDVDRRERDAAFIAAANPTAVIELLDAIADLTAENARLREALRPFSINTRNILRSFGDLRAVSIVVENFNTDNTYPLCVGDLRRAAQEMEGK